MKTPVIICARNEADKIGETLNKLPSEGIEPIVVANGCEDNTAKIAETFGATVLVEEKAGKLSAIKTAFYYLGERALDPVITLDADTRLVFSNHWLQGMINARRQLDKHQPAIVVGPIMYEGGFGPIARSVYRGIKQKKLQHNNHAGAFSGGNMLIHSKLNTVVEKIINLDEFWPGEDVAIKDALVATGGQTIKSLDARSLVVTDGSRFPGLGLRLSKGREEALKVILHSYRQDAPLGSKPYGPAVGNLWESDKSTQ